MVGGARTSTVEAGDSLPPPRVDIEAICDGSALRIRKPNGHPELAHQQEGSGGLTDVSKGHAANPSRRISKATCIPHKKIIRPWSHKPKSW